VSAFGAGFAAGVPLIALVSSPSSSNTAITWLTGTSCVPSATTILPIVPSSTASTSIVALSVSISAITSPALTLSPSFFSHLDSLPSSIVGESAGMVIWIGIRLAPVQHGFDRGDDFARGGQSQRFEIGGVGHRQSRRDRKSTR